MNNILKNIIIFNFSPITSFFYCIVNRNSLSSRIFLVLFSGYLGLSFNIDDNKDFDAVRYKKNFIDFYTDQDADLSLLLTNLYKDAESYEITSNFISILLSHFTDNYHFLFGAFGLFYGFFLVSNIYNIRLLLDFISVPETNLSGYFFYTFLFIIPIWYINGFDFWAASQIFIYSVLKFFKRSYFIGFLALYLSTITHYSFIILTPVIFLFFITSKIRKYFFILFILSFVLPYFFYYEMVYLIESFTPQVIFQKVQIYLLTNNESLVVGGRILKVIDNLFYYSVLFTFLFFYFNYINFLKNHELINKILGFTIFFLIVTNFLSIIPILARFKTISVFLMILSIFYIHSFMNYYTLNKINLIPLTYLFFIFNIYNLSNILFSLFPILGIKAILSNLFFSVFWFESDFVIGNVMDFVNFNAY
jgi:hypothetical protein